MNQIFSAAQKESPQARHSTNDEPWYETKEGGSSLAIRLLVALYRVLGRQLFLLLLYPVALTYLLISSSARRSTYIVYDRLQAEGVPLPSRVRHAFQTFYLFARSMLDAVRGWRQDINPRDVQWNGVELPHALIDSGEGAVILTAHFGPVEASRALHRLKEGHELFAIMYLKNAMKFRGVLQAVSPTSHDDVIPVEEMNMATMGKLQEKLQEGAFLGFMGDRLSPLTTERFIEVEFLGKTAYLPEGPFLLAALLQVPVLGGLSAYEKGVPEFILEWRKLNVDPDLPRKARVEKLAFAYRDFLEEYCKKYPQQFFNFYDFWEKPS